MPTAIKTTAPLSRLFRAEWTQRRPLRSPEDSADRGETRAAPLLITFIDPLVATGYQDRSFRRFLTPRSIGIRFDPDRARQRFHACQQGDIGLLDNAWSANFGFDVSKLKPVSRPFLKLNFISYDSFQLFDRFDSVFEKEKFSLFGPLLTSRIPL